MEQIIGLKKFRENVEGYARQVSKGRSFIVVKRSRPVFKIVPLVPEVDEPYHDPNYKTIIDFTKIRPGGVPIEDIVRAMYKIKDGQAGKGNRKTAKRT